MVIVWVTQLGWAAPPEPFPYERATLVVLRALAYDRALGGSGPLILAVVGDRAGFTQALTAQVERLQGIEVGGRPLGPPKIVGLTTVDWALALRGVDVVLLGGGVEEAMPALVAAVDPLDLPLVSFDPRHGGRGPALLVYPQDRQLVIAYDHRAAEAQGARFAAELLELAIPVPR